MTELKPCPFCGGTDLRIMGGIGKYVKCRSCEASSGHLPGGACAADEHAAAQAWNARTTPERRCVECGGYYVPTNGGQKYCSPRCRNKAYMDRRIAEGDMPPKLGRLYEAKVMER